MYVCTYLGKVWLWELLQWQVEDLLVVVHDRALNLFQIVMLKKEKRRLRHKITIQQNIYIQIISFNMLKTNLDKE
jgi:hypothetical protein